MLVSTLRTSLDSFEATPPPVPEAPTEADLKPWRDRIDLIDRAVVELLNERSRCANAIGFIKKKIGTPVYAPRREEEVITNVLLANRGPLPDASIRRIIERIIDETRALERERYQDE